MTIPNLYEGWSLRTEKNACLHGLSPIQGVALRPHDQPTEITHEQF
jgi:hypothetical protein